MSREVYSFIKIHKNGTDRGLIYGSMGIISILCLLVLILVSFAGGGTLPTLAGALGYLSFVMALLGTYLSTRLQDDPEAYGRMVGSCLYIDIAAVIFHAVVFFTGCFASVL